MKKIAVFVDVQNIYYTVKQVRGCHFNYRELWRQLSCEGEIVKAYAYAIDRGDAQQQGFQQILRDVGFEVKLRPYIQRRDGSAKGDWDVGLTIDVMDTFAAAEGSADCLVLLSGDGDFDLLLQRVSADCSATTIVYGVPSLTAASLINSATEFRAIESTLLLNN